jgi:Ni/Fe-hydrogenase subunit HybB-like protein
MLLAALSTPLVLSVHSVVSFDFATSVVPGWHTTIFPPYFVAGAIFGGFAMVLTLMIPRRIYGLEDLITPKHIDNMAKIILLTGTIVGYAYCMELFMAYYSANPYEAGRLHASRPHRSFHLGLLLHVQLQRLRPAALLVSPLVRHNMWVVMFVCMCVNAGMWFERYVIIATTLERTCSPAPGAPTGHLGRSM